MKNLRKRSSSSSSSSEQSKSKVSKSIKTPYSSKHNVSLPEDGNSGTERQIELGMSHSDQLSNEESENVDKRSVSYVEGEIREVNYASIEEYYAVLREDYEKRKSEVKATTMKKAIIYVGLIIIL